MAASGQKAELSDNGGLPVPGKNSRRRPDLLALIVLGVVLAVLVVGYFLFPYAQRVVWYQDCIASGRVTGC
jgi:hypothetical protein